ncbi:hypothetical protein EUX98_g2189 [Antrodiella citrinella]|uniref:Ino eighty subunit 1 n=1 Tax=Antrodiella citrinella TaxID=2447956 RepID=A0A4S4MZN7_9APHY|nr:hypothetical protein EUX98_g2189 [Antrodiella citrinella]
MPNAGPQGPYRKSLAIKHLDGEPLTRHDIQYDVLYYLFSSTEAVFTDPFPTIHGGPAGTKVTFRDLYVNALAHSSKCSKVTKDKLLETPEFGVEFSKISLLSNVGRINTTMAFFPEMRTALRTYHPVPSLQKTDGNLQDAPRIKNILKSCFTPNELSNPPFTPADVLARSRSGEVPATSIVNMMFVFAGHAAVIAQTHFAAQTGHDLLDFFCPVNISSESRARAILWLCYHYLEAPSHNPFDDDFSRSHPGKVPELVILAEDEVALENVDPADEKEWGEKMSAERKVFMANKDKEALAAEDGAEPASRSKPGKGRGRGGKAKTATTPRKRASTSKLGKLERSSPSLQAFVEDGLSSKDAFFMVMNTDPLQDSENEEESEENTRLDLLLRLRIINRLRGKAPTPEPEHVPLDPVPFTFTRTH